MVVYFTSNTRYHPLGCCSSFRSEGVVRSGRWAVGVASLVGDPTGACQWFTYRFGASCAAQVATRWDMLWTMGDSYRNAFDDETSIP
jgi:hypothetical protein